MLKKTNLKGKQTSMGLELLVQELRKKNHLKKKLKKNIQSFMTNKTKTKDKMR